MKIKFFYSFSLLLIAALALNACSPPSAGPRYEQDGPKAWTVQETPDNSAVRDKGFVQYDVNKAYAMLADSKTDLMNQILKPLSAFVLNKRFIELPKYRVQKMTEMIQVFNTAFLALLQRHENSADFQKLKDSYFATVFAGCSRDLRTGCINDNMFSWDPRETKILTAMASEYDSPIEALLKKYDQDSDLCIKNSPDCQSLIEKRYYLLSMAFKANHNSYKDSTFSFAYMKYARLFSSWVNYVRDQQAQTVAGQNGPFDNMSLSYVSDTNGEIFQGLISQYKPKNLDDPSLRQFVEDFNPWTYSRKQANLFQYGTRIMFELGSKCCLYKGGQLDPAVKKAIRDSQNPPKSKSAPVETMCEKSQKPHGDKAFAQMVKDVVDSQGEALFDKLGLGGKIAELENVNSDFYNEYFFIVDRLFRGDLNSADVAMVLNNIPASRQPEVMLPKTIDTYVKVNLIYMIVETNRFMNGIYQSSVASGEVFTQALTQSRDLTSRWYMLQSNIDLLDRMMGSYFKGLNDQTKEYVDAAHMLESVSRNIHYLSVYPNMFVTNYFLALKKGVIKVTAWWGQTFEIDSNTILTLFLDGQYNDVWFQFSKDPEPLNRQMLLYGWDFMLKTNTLDSFANTGCSNAQATSRTQFMDTLFTKYLSPDISNLRTEVENYRLKLQEIEPSVDAMCDYELDGKSSGIPPAVSLSLLGVGNYTYTGLGSNGTNKNLESFLIDGGDIAADMLRDIRSRITYVKVMLDLVDADAVSSGRIKKGQPNPETAGARDLLQQLYNLKLEVTQLFTQHQKRYFQCYMALQDIEKRRINRLYMEERNYLGHVYDIMKPLNQIPDQPQYKAQLDAQVKTLNDQYFNSKAGYRFDHIEGKTYVLSEYDLLMRMKKRIESDVFTQPTPEEMQVYASEPADYQYFKPRNVSVYIPPGIENDDIVAKQIEKIIQLTPSRQEFIDQAMQKIAGDSDPFLYYHGQLNTDDGALKYLSSLEKFYVLGPVKDAKGNVYGITPQDVVDAYNDILASYSMNSFDVENAKELGFPGRFDKTFYQGRLFETDGSGQPLPFFSSLMNDMYNLSEISLTGGGPMGEAINFARSLNGLGTFVFSPSPEVRASVAQNYGAAANGRMQRLNAFYNYIESQANEKKTVSAFDPRLTQPFYIENGSSVQWYSPKGVNPLVDGQRPKDLAYMKQHFEMNTGDLYQTTTQQAGTTTGVQ